MSVLTEMQAKQNANRESLATEAFSLLRRDRANDKELKRLGELVTELGWSKPYLAALEWALTQTRNMASELAKPAATNEEIDALDRELQKLQAEWEKAEFDYRTKRIGLVQRITGMNDGRRHKEQVQAELVGLRELFSPLFGEGTTWGHPTNSTGPGDPFYDNVTLLAKEDAAR